MISSLLWVVTGEEKGLLGSRWLVAHLPVPRARVVGNIKFDAIPPPADPVELSTLAGCIGARPVWAAVSTHHGEEEIVAEAHLPGGVVEQGRFATTTPGLLVLRDWLVELGVTRVGIESTGVYWKAPYYVLEEAMEVWLLNARHMRNIPGRKTDVSDASWICQLIEFGLELVAK